MRMETSNGQSILKLVNSKLEVRRDELTDIISSSLNSTNPDRVSSVYESVLELATIEKALELNRYFQIQVQENLLSTILKETQKGDTKTEGDKELKK
jgi:hypothetical protein